MNSTKRKRSDAADPSNKKPRIESAAEIKVKSEPLDQDESAHVKQEPMEDMSAGINVKSEPVKQESAAESMALVPYGAGQAPVEEPIPNLEHKSKPSKKKSKSPVSDSETNFSKIKTKLNGFKKQFFENGKSKVIKKREKKAENRDGQIRQAILNVVFPKLVTADEIIKKNVYAATLRWLKKIKEMPKFAGTFPCPEKTPPALRQLQIDIVNAFRGEADKVYIPKGKKIVLDKIDIETWLQNKWKELSKIPLPFLKYKKLGDARTLKVIDVTCYVLMAYIVEPDKAEELHTFINGQSNRAIDKWHKTPGSLLKDSQKFSHLINNRPIPALESYLGAAVALGTQALSRCTQGGASLNPWNTTPLIFQRVDPQEFASAYTFPHMPASASAVQAQASHSHTALSLVDDDARSDGTECEIADAEISADAQQVEVHASHLQAFAQPASASASMDTAAILRAMMSGADLADVNAAAASESIPQAAVAKRDERPKFFRDLSQAPGAGMTALPANLPAKKPAKLIESDEQRKKPDSSTQHPH